MSFIERLRVYQTDDITVQFFQRAKALDVKITTPHLELESVKIRDVWKYAKLFGDKDVMQKYATGQPKTFRQVCERVKGWVLRWQSGDPFSGLAIRSRDSREFIGHVVLGHGDAPGESEIAALFHKKHWSKGFGAEVAQGLGEYAKAIIQEGYLLEGKPLEKIVATSRVDNLLAVQLLKNAGMHFVKAGEKFGALREHYAIATVELFNRSFGNQRKAAG